MERDWAREAVSAAEAVSVLQSGMNVFVHGAAATPTPLLKAMVRRKELDGVRLFHLHTAGETPFVEPDCAGRFFSISLFTGAPLRKPIEEGRADFMPIFLSDIPALFRSGRIRLDAALLQVSPPDVHGYCTLGTSVDTAKAAADSARVIVAEINEQMPRTHGNTVVPFERITAFTHTDRPLVEHVPEPETEVDARIGEIIAGLVEDGSTLQMGIGAIPDAALFRLREKRDLGIHTEMFSDRVVELVEAGAVTNRFKSVHPNRIVTSFVSGTRKLFRFVHDNPLVEFHPCDRTNDTSLIRRNDKVVAINSCLQVDLTGQVCADSIGHRIYSGIGGQMDFIHGAALSRGGKPILAFRSTASGGKVSRIVPELSPGGGVVTTRGHVHWMITEHGAVNLHGMTLRERGEALISIAHPDFRPELARAFGAIRHFIVPGLH
ncbi:MAG: acetyl-CoA hydrolase/transferase family protein [Deltaproteobacteria bacterium]|nr:acetyl-CoA hydrolase/transferase family protein [Deltaproteobacteria bacterium]NNG47124.1 acetyl-CoA hydrolase/transferase family protein [Deltaproteobacteria bacterium]